MSHLIEILLPITQSRRNRANLDAVRSELTCAVRESIRGLSSDFGLARRSREFQSLVVPMPSSSISPRSTKLPIMRRGAILDLGYQGRLQPHSLSLPIPGRDGDIRLSEAIEADGDRLLVLAWEHGL